MSEKPEKRMTRKQKRMRRLWLSVRPMVVMLISLVVVFLLARTTVNYVLAKYIEPVDRNDATPIEVTIPASSSASSIARILYGACGYDKDGLISSTAAFKVYVDFVGKANSLKAGTYVLSKNMSIKQIVETLCEGNPAKATVKFTIPEGYTIQNIAKVLQEKGLVQSEDQLYVAARTGEAFANFAFVADAGATPNATSRSYVLEGYLFPDTYEVYADASVETILIKLLNRFNEVYSDEYVARAQQLGMTMDQIVTLASLIEREAAAANDFAKVSAVFHNRLNQDMPLQSCASLSYALGVTKYVFNATEQETDSLYNTYIYAGLPPGPISNPTLSAIQAVAFPAQTPYFYFRARCDGTGRHAFAKTYEEHLANGCE
jgi:UPF0755 protein